MTDMNTDKVSFRQFAITAFVGLFSPISRLLPRMPLKAAGISCIVSPFAALLPSFALILVQSRIMKNGGENDGIAQVLTNSFGNAVGKAVTVIYGLWIITYGGFILRSGAERLLSTVYPSANTFFFLAVMILISIMAARGKVSWTVRSSVILGGVFCAALAMIYILALGNVKPEYIWPVNFLRSDRILLSAVPVIDVISPWVYLGFVRGYVRQEPKMMKTSVAMLAAIFVSVLLLLICTVGIVGPELAVRQQFPFFVMIRNLTVPNVIERIEPVIITVWMVTDYVFVTMLLISATEAFKHVFSLKKRKSMVLPCAAVMFAVSCAVAPNAFVFSRISSGIVPAVNLGFVFIGLPAIAAAKMIMEKINEKRGEKKGERG